MKVVDQRIRAQHQPPALQGAARDEARGLGVFTTIDSDLGRLLLTETAAGVALGQFCVDLEFAG